MRKHRKAGPKGDINVTPFIDILLVLIVIFMTITPLTPKGLDAQVPQPPPPGTPPPPSGADKTVVISIDSNEVIKINQDAYDLKDLASALQNIFRTRNERIVFINAHPDLLYNNIVQLIDIAKGAGVDKVGLMTEQITSH